MIHGIGIDAVEIERFVAWAHYSRKQLQRIFSDAEIDYCLSVPAKTAERFAARFAAREAFFKAFSAAYPEHSVPFLTVCKSIELQKNELSVPMLKINWTLLKVQGAHNAPCTCHVSVTHTATTATVIVILEVEQA